MDGILLSLSNIQSNGAHIIWLYGPAGSGKSTVAATICRSLRRTGQLGGAVFFSTLSERTRKPDLVFTDLASELVMHIPALGDKIWDAIKRDPGIRKADPARQFRELIVSPYGVLVRRSNPLSLCLTD
jgi:ATP/maltotriose-dependent transcriptional regulator MalT